MRTLLVVQKNVIQIDAYNLNTCIWDVLIDQCSKKSNDKLDRRSIKVTKSRHHSRFVLDVNVKAAVVHIKGNNLHEF